MKNILIVDDEKHILEDLSHQLGKRNYAVYTASTIEDARKIILSENLDFAIIDLTLDFKSEFGGINIVNFTKRNKPNIKTIILSAYPFEDVKGQLKKQLKELNDHEKMLFEIEQDYISKGGKENYIIAIIKKLEELNIEESKKTCFVIMPFSETKSCNESEWDEIYKHLIKPGIEDSGYNFCCLKSEAIYGSIIENILDDLNRSDIVIADLTDRNPNVFYELGVRHALRDTTILISQNIEEIPFDLRTYATLEYNWKTTSDREKFKSKLKSILKFIEENPEKAISPVRKYLKLN